MVVLQEKIVLQLWLAVSWVGYMLEALCGRTGFEHGLQIYVLLLYTHHMPSLSCSRSLLDW